MRAMLIRSFGNESVLELADVRPPQPGPDEVLVRVAAVAVSRTRDIATRTGKHPFSRQVTLPHVLGGDFAGTIERVGTDLTDELVGQRVAGACGVTCGRCRSCLGGHSERCESTKIVGIHRWGSYAEYVSIPAVNVRRIPDNISMPEAAALAATGPIAYKQLDVADVHEGASVLVTGATGALGSVLLTLVDLRGAQGIALSRRPAEIPTVLPNTARLDCAEPNLGNAILEATEGHGAHAAIDNVADPEVFPRYFPALSVGGRVVISGGIGVSGAPVLSVPVGPLYIRSISLIGVRSCTLADTEAFWRLVDDGFRLPAGLIRTFPIEEAPAVHASITEGSTMAHTVLTFD
jgi:D-arabinose 1-dehydrogenase-like Zn-dependent alcohol dehydrogenase